MKKIGLMLLKKKELRWFMFYTSNSIDNNN